MTVNPNVVTEVPAFAPHVDNCICGETWRFETVDLSTGALLGLLHPISASWEERHSSPGVAQLTLASRMVAPADVWPHDVGLYISQVVDGNRVGRWAGMFEEYDAGSGGSASIALAGIDAYLDHRNVADDDSGVRKTYSHVKQSEIAADLARLAVQVEGINLVPVAGESNIFRDRTYESWEIKNIGEAIKQLTEVINGVQYYLTHEYGNGFWQTKIRFQDAIGADRGVALRGDIEGATYSVKVSANDHATHVYAVGEGQEEAQKLSVAYDAAKVYPRFHAVPAWADVSVQETLDEHARGYVVDHRDPVATPQMTIPGLSIPPEQLQLGDRVLVQFSYGLASFDGYAKILGIGWTLQEGAPVMRALTFQPEVRSSQSVRVLVNVGPSGSVFPGVTAGAVSNLQDPRIIKPAGITHSKSS